MRKNAKKKQNMIQKAVRRPAVRRLAAFGLGILWIALTATAWGQTNAKKKSAQDRMQNAQSKADSLRAKLQKSTGLDAQLPGLDPSASLSLPGGGARVSRRASPNC